MDEMGAPMPGVRTKSVREAGMFADGTAATVEGACRRYVEDRRVNKSVECAHDNHRRFERTVYGSPRHAANPIAGVRLTQLRAHHLLEWRNSLGGLSRGSVNRTTTALRAALMLAITEGSAPPKLLGELRRLKPYKNLGTRRTLFLDRSQRRALIDACAGGLRDLLEAAAVTGCRAGELTSALVRQFDARQSTLSVMGKTGQRVVILSPGAVELFARRSAGRRPDEYLLTRDDGRRWAHSDWDERVKDAARRAGLPRETVLYTLRHSWITETLMGGMTTLEVARIAGTSLAMIEKHYGHLVLDAARARLAKVPLL